MAVTDHKTNDRSTENINTHVNVADRGENPTPVEVRQVHGNRYLGTVTTTSGFICLLQAFRMTPSDVSLSCDDEQRRVWCDIAWHSPELAAYSGGKVT